MGVALCFDDMIPDELGYSGPLNKFFGWLWADYIEGMYHTDHIDSELKTLEKNFLMFDGNESVSSISDYSKLQDMFSEEFHYISYDKLKKSEKVVMDVLNYLGCWDDRKIKIGVSAVANAWTDGSSYIAFDRKWLFNRNFSTLSEVLKVFTVGCHELAHDDNSAGTHNHGPEFYEKYYNITMLGSWYNPLSYVYNFSEKMKQRKIDQKIELENKKDKELKEQLGLVKSVSEE
jgi:hypothetical protein